MRHPIYKKFDTVILQDGLKHEHHEPLPDNISIKISILTFSDLKKHDEYFSFSVSASVNIPFGEPDNSYVSWQIQDEFHIRNNELENYKLGYHLIKIAANNLLDLFDNNDNIIEDIEYDEVFNDIQQVFILNQRLLHQK
ncbi:MAG TPA: hypothetical protein PK431_11635 [Chitinophagales bacterium]|nr:hypothetical protein [Chitinophagales bacterium]